MTHSNDHELEPMPEGEEQEPPLTRTMSVTRWVLFGGMCLFALIMVFGYLGVGPWNASDGDAAQYHCPMHPTYVSNQPGDCPICGMSVVPIGDKTAVESADMSHAGDAWMRETQAQHGQYGCPMDPSVVSDSAGRCPICRMHLVQVDTSAIGHVSSESDVPGLTDVTIAPERLQLIGLKTSIVDRRTIEAPIRATGYITPDETRIVDVQARVSGWVQELHVDQTGQHVERGQPLLSIYSPELYQTWLDYHNARELEQTTLDPELKKLRAEITAAGRNRLLLLGLSDADLDRMSEQDLSGSRITLRSPASGNVLAKTVQQGQEVAPGMSLMTVADLRMVWIIVNVSGGDAAMVHIGDTVSVELTEATSEVLSGTVSFIYPTVSVETRTSRARIEVPNPGLRFRPGMYVTVSVHSKQRSVLAIPAEAVLDGGEIQYAFVVHDGNHFTPRRIMIGQRGGDWIEVLSGLAEGEIVVISANFLIDSESRLQAAIAGMGQVETAPAAPAHQH